MALKNAKVGGGWHCGSDRGCPLLYHCGSSTALHAGKVRRGRINIRHGCKLKSSAAAYRVGVGVTVARRVWGALLVKAMGVLDMTAGTSGTVCEALNWKLYRAVE